MKSEWIEGPPSPVTTRFCWVIFRGDDGIYLAEVYGRGSYVMIIGTDEGFPLENVTHHLPVTRPARPVAAGVAPPPSPPRSPGSG